MCLSVCVCVCACVCVCVCVCVWKLTKPLKGGGFLGQTLIKKMHKKVKWVVKFVQTLPSKIRDGRVL